MAPPFPSPRTSVSPRICWTGAAVPAQFLKLRWVLSGAGKTASPPTTPTLCTRPSMMCLPPCGLWGAAGGGGVGGGEEDCIAPDNTDDMYSTVDDARATVQALGVGERGRYLTALTFGNVHGVYNPASVHLRPEILGDIQATIGAEVGRQRPFDLVFHGGSGSAPEEIKAAVSHGVVKMNIDTDTQYAFTRSLAGHVLSNWNRVLKVDGGYGDKKAYDPRSWGASAEAAMA